jgi:CBS domain-containing protein
MKVSEVMHKGVASVSPDAPIGAIATRMRDEDVGALPVTEKGKLIGIVTDRDIAIRALADGHDVARLTARQVMSRNVAFCREGDTAEKAVELMESRQVRRLPVLDNGDKVVGIVSLGDISHAMPRDISAEVLKSVSAHHP